MDIIDAQSIASAAEVSAWNEEDDDADSALEERYWRQTFDVEKFERWRSGSKKGRKAPAGLSELKKHCVCETEYNPDGTMFKCPSDKCGIWNHEECLADAILEDVYGRSLRGELGKKKKEKDQTEDAGEPEVEKIDVKPSPPKSPTKLPYPAEKISEIFNSVKRQIFTPTPDAGEDHDEVKQPPKAVKRKKPNGSPRPWDGKFRCEVWNEDPELGQGKAIATVVDLRRSNQAKKTKSAAESGGPKEWKEDVRCLRCGSLMV